MFCQSEVENHFKFKKKDATNGLTSCKKILSVDFYVYGILICTNPKNHLLRHNNYLVI